MHDRHATTRKRFPSTHWTSIHEAARVSQVHGRAAMERFIQRYHPALRAHLIAGRRTHPNDIDDVLQQFIADKVIERELLRHAEQSRGRFRNLLLKSLENFTKNYHRREQAHRGGRHHQTVSLEECEEPAGASEVAAQSFDVTWSRHVVGRAIWLMKSECRRKGQHNVWLMFRYRVLWPLLRQRQPMAYPALVARCGLPSPSTAFNLLTTARRSYNRACHKIILEYAGNQTELHDEIIDLHRILSQSVRHRPRRNGG